MKADLIRVEETDEGTIGVLRLNGIAVCVTLELPDRDNKKEESRIPDGDYWCERVDSPKYGRTYCVSDVPGRSYILFHAGNTVDDTQGCILLGQYFGKFRGARAILNSGNTFKDFLAYCEVNIQGPLLGFSLKVRSV